MIKNDLIKAIAQTQYRLKIHQGKEPRPSAKRLLVTVIKAHNEVKKK